MKSNEDIAKAISEKLSEIEHARTEVERIEAEPLPTLLPAPEGMEAKESHALSTVTETERGPLAPRFEQARLLISGKRNELSLAQKRFLKLRSELNTLITKQTSGLAELERKYADKLASISTALDAANLYLGRNEEYTVLRTGAKADQETPISIRQGVLFMDEESALNALLAEDGGIVFETIPEFDKWLLADPKNLTQVLPEEKGIIGIRVRRHERNREHMDALEAAQKAALDGTCFFLLRNGENLYRLENNCPPIADTLVPTSREFQALFENKFYRNGTSGQEEYLRPGSEQFTRAMKKAEGKHTHYLKIALAIQGVLDRTQIFHPLPEHLKSSGQAGNLFAAAGGVEVSNIRIIRDLENVLAHNHPSFCEWLRTRNQFTAEGSRIILGPGAVSKDSIEPRHVGENNHKPDTYVDYIAEAHPYEKETIIIRFHYGTWGGVSARRAKANFYKESWNYINIDDPEGKLESEINFYLQDRMERKNYKESVPLLVRAKQLIQKEKQEETPFAALCVSMLKLHFQVTFPKKELPKEETFEKITRACITWFKRKNRLQRALRTQKETGRDIPDDDKAFTGVCDEAKRRLEKIARGEGKSKRDDQIKSSILALHPETLFIGQKAGGFFVSLEPETPLALIAQPGFLKEILWHWNAAKNTAEIREEARWKLKSPRHSKLREILSTEKWKAIHDNLRPNERLTEPEILEFVEKLRIYSEFLERKKETICFAATFEPDTQRFTLYGAGPRFADPNGGQKNYKECLSMTHLWEKKQGKVSHQTGYRRGGFYSTHWIGKGSSFGSDRTKNPEHLAGIPITVREETEQLLWLDTSAASKALKVMEGHWLREGEREESLHASMTYWNAFQRGYNLTRLNEEKRIYLVDDAGVEELWDEHFKTLPNTRREPGKSLDNWGCWRLGIESLLECNVLPSIPKNQCDAPAIPMQEIAQLNTEHKTGWTIEAAEAKYLDLPWITPPTLEEIRAREKAEEEAEQAEKTEETEEKECQYFTTDVECTNSSETSPSDC